MLDKLAVISVQVPFATVYLYAKYTPPEVNDYTVPHCLDQFHSNYRNNFHFYAAF